MPSTGQGFLTPMGLRRMLEIAQEQIASGNNQYAPLRGRPELIDALAYHYSVARKAIAVTAGATEAITATVLDSLSQAKRSLCWSLTTTYAAAIADATRVPVLSSLLEEVGTSTSMLCAPIRPRW